MAKVTLSVIKADIGGYVGHGQVHTATTDRCQEFLADAKAHGQILDFHVSSVGDDINLIMTHERGVDASDIHKLAWDTFVAATDVAKDLHLYAAGQDLLADAFSGNVRGLGPGVAEMEFEERPSEPVIVFMADKTEPGAFNLPLYRIFADPFNSVGLVIDTKMHDGFSFEMHDLAESRKILFRCPEDLYTMLMFIGSPAMNVIKAVYSRALDEVAAVNTTTKLSLIAGRYVGKDDPSMVVRCQSGLPAVGEVLEAFATPWYVAGWMRGSSCGPLIPCAQHDAHPARFDGPPRVVALGFQVANGKLIGPRDMFDDLSFDQARRMANEMAYYMRRQGPFEPARLPMHEMEYTTMPQIMAKIGSRFVPIDGDAREEVLAVAGATDGSETD